jgi:hypothetical protein
VLLDAGRTGEAEAVYVASLDRFADNGYALKGLELSLDSQGRVSEAEEVRERFAISWRAADVELPGSRF